jgi:exosortase C (VPDSG-CTERM-specific)
LFAAKSELYSYILLVPFVFAYLMKLGRAQFEPAERRGSWWGVVPLLSAMALLGGYYSQIARGWSPAPVDYLALITLSFLCFLLGGAFFFFGARSLRPLTFPLAFGFFMVPLPETVRRVVEAFLQHGSAEVASAMLKLSGMPVFQNGTWFRLPGFDLDVAPECSGIHSSLILVITSLLAAYLFLKSKWRRSVLVLATVPLALLRNGFRIFTIAQLCVRIGPEMIDSSIHRRGGPIFFALSLVPLLILLIFLRRGELRKAAGAADFK